MTGDRVLGSLLASGLLVALWLGAGLIVTTVVAPAAFDVLPTRALAGAMVGRVLPVLFWSGAAVGIGTVLLARGTAGGVARSIAGSVMIVACLAAQLAVAPRIRQVRDAAGAPIDQLLRGDPRRIAFGRLHAGSVALLGVSSIAAASALLFTWRALRRANRGERLPHPSHEL